MAQNYLVTAVCRPVGEGVACEHIARFVYYDPATLINMEIEVQSAIAKIESGEAIYFIYENGNPVNLNVVTTPVGKFLRSNGNLHQRDSLLEMHRCVCLWKG